MYTIEYLILLDFDKTKCKTVKALRSILQSNSDIEIEKDKISYNGYVTTIIIRLGKKNDASHLFFSIGLKCDFEKDIDNFSRLLKAIRNSLSLITKTHYVIWDDLSLFYAQQAYPIVFDIENIMRLLITKFMLTNIGVGWTKDRIPTDVQQSINPNNKDLNYLNNVDFIQLKNFLFSENYPNHKESLIKELKNAKDFSKLDLDEIKSLLPASNWDKFFEPIVGCEADYLKKRWEKLYDLRCKIAHNKTFNKADLEDVKKLVSELKPHLIKALSSLYEIVITEEEKENVAENVVINMNEVFGEFIIKFRQLEKFIYSITNHLKVNIEGNKIKGYGNQTGFLKDKGIISVEQYSVLKRIFHTRNSIVHHNDLSITLKEIGFAEVMIEELIQFFKLYFRENLDEE